MAQTTPMFQMARATVRLPILLVLVLSLASASGCDRSLPAGTPIDAGSGAADALVVSDLRRNDLLPCLVAQDAGVAGTGAPCGNAVCATGEYCCTAPGAVACARSNCGCTRWWACFTTSNCPPAHPACCLDDPDHVDCRATCQYALCLIDRDCPAARPRCKPDPRCSGLECLSVCQAP